MRTDSPRPETPCIDSTCVNDACRRERLVRDHLGLAHHLARRYQHRGIPLDDLVQVASLALVQAAHRFDEQRGLAFTAYVAPTIVGEIKHHFRDRLWDLRVPRRVQDLHVTLHTLVDPLTHRLGHTPTVAELAAHAGVSTDEALEALEAGRAFTARSIDAVPAADSLADATPLWPSDDDLQGVEQRLLISSLLTKLPPREQLIVRLRYYDNMSQREIAERLGISQMHVSRLLSRSLETLRDAVPAADRATA